MHVSIPERIEILRLWKSGKRVEQIASATGRSIAEVRTELNNKFPFRHCQQCGFPLGRRKIKGFCSVECECEFDASIEEPPPDELAKRCAEVRAGWSDEVRIARMRADLRPVAFSVHTYRAPIGG